MYRKAKKRLDLQPLTLPDQWFFLSAVASGKRQLECRVQRLRIPVLCLTTQRVCKSLMFIKHLKQVLNPIIRQFTHWPVHFKNNHRHQYLIFQFNTLVHHAMSHVVAILILSNAFGIGFGAQQVTFQEKNISCYIILFYDL